MRKFDYAAGIPLTILDDELVADPTTASPGMLSASKDQGDEAAGMPIEMLDELPGAVQGL